MKHEASNLIPKGFLNSRVARRVYLLFILCSLVPLGLLAFFEHHNIKGQLTRQAESRTREISKAAGMTLYQRLFLAELDLERIGGDVADGRPDALTGATLLQKARRDAHFATIHVKSDRRGWMSPDSGDRIIPSLSKEQIDWLEDRGAHLFIKKDAEGAAFLGLLILRIREDGERLFTYGKIKNSFLFGAGFSSPSEKIAVYTQEGDLLLDCRSMRIPEEEFYAARSVEQSTGVFRWQEDGMTNVGGYWLLFAQTRFAMNLMIVACEPSAEILQPLEDDRRILALSIGLALLIVALLGSVQIRRSLYPIMHLKLVTQQIAEGNLMTRVDIRSRDEFEDLGHAFNDMAQAIGSDRRAKTEFLATMSHELRTPMNAV
ncbi:MAG: HAMP domain-containing protein, partial [Planctomycetota bacterium]